MKRKKYLEGYVDLNPALKTFKDILAYYLYLLLSTYEKPPNYQCLNAGYIAEFNILCLKKIPENCLRKNVEIFLHPINNS